jgi:hypothetical protein
VEIVVASSFRCRKEKVKFPAISKWHNVIPHLKKKNKMQQNITAFADEFGIILLILKVKDTLLQNNNLQNENLENLK